jgi:peptidoglycan/LPS O-acetylase OafA/YrhL
MTRRYFPLFDSLRGIAALSVLTFHVVLMTPLLGAGPVGRVAAVLGSVGVLLFFAISGFLLYRPYVAAKVDGRPGPALGQFLRRRALRILPAYWVILTVMVVYPAVRLDGGFWRYYGFLQLYDRDTISLGMPVAWSLCVEVTFYLALPLWAWALRRRGLRAEWLALAAVAAAGLVLQLLAVDHDRLYVLSRTLLGQAPFFAIGMGLAVLSVLATHRADEPPAARLAERHGAWAWLGAGGALAGLALLVTEPGIAGLVEQNALLGVDGTALRLALSLLFVGLLVVPAAFGDGRRDVSRRVLAWRPLVWVGMVSYSVYLWHLPVAELLALDAVPTQFDAHGLGLVGDIGFFETPVLWLLTAAITLVLSAISFRWVELPFIRRAGSASPALPPAREW